MNSLRRTDSNADFPFLEDQNRLVRKTKDAERYVRKFVSMVGWQKIQKRSADLHQMMEKNPFLEEIILSVHGIEIEICELYVHILNKTKTKSITKLDNYQNVLGFCIEIAEIYDALSSDSQNILKGRLSSGFKGNVGLNPLRLELLTFKMLLSAGWRVGLSDFEKPGGFDFLAERNGSLLEVECKAFSEDVGRSIKNSAIATIGEQVFSHFPDIDREENREVKLTRVQLGPRFKGTSKDCAIVASEIVAHLQWRAGPESELIEGIDDNSDSSLVLNNKFPSLRADVENYLLNKYGDRSPAVVGRLRSKGGHLLSIAPQKPAKLTDTVFRRLREDSKRQFSGDHMCCLAVQLLGVDTAGLKKLRQSEVQNASARPAHGLQEIANRLFEIRPKLIAIWFIPNDTRKFESTNRIGRQPATSGTFHEYYVYLRQDHPFIIENGNPIHQP